MKRRNSYVFNSTYSKVDYIIFYVGVILSVPDIWNGYIYVKQLGVVYQFIYFMLSFLLPTRPLYIRAKELHREMGLHKSCPIGVLTVGCCVRIRGNNAPVSVEGMGVIINLN